MKPIANHITVMYRTAVSCLQTICYYELATIFTVLLDIHNI